ncbi:hypothetical protein MOQ_001666 [Trypanosoma cruzi marinkellei]|uniref:Protein kinase domain-containing protein n=1 Tax=Trypanosoma cruzi marinkellei TaxID=85056 RepID=K2NFT1_TRYCR|nr:hypothetical protein MOQ_001666 [Trypanosoma cruzi marinkellei]
MSMRTPFSSATSLADRAVSPSQCLYPRTTARQIHPLVFSPITPMDPKTKSPHYPQSPQSLQSGSHEAEGLGRTEPQSLLPTFLAADFDVVDVSARLENEFFSAAQSAELGGSRSRHLQDTIDCHENCSSAEKLFYRNGNCCRADVTEEMTQVFQEPVTPLREAFSLIEENREGQNDDAQEERASNSPSSVHTPPDNIIRSSLVMTPPWTPVLATPRKSAKRPSPQAFTPSTHRRGVSSHNVSVESREVCGVLPHITHADYLPPNRNPCSPYLEYADERQLLVQLRMEEEGEEEMDDGLISTTDGMLQRADACAIVLEQTVPIASAVRTEKCRPPLFSTAGKGGGGANTFLNEVREEDDISDLSPVLMEMDMAVRRNASATVETGDVSSGNHFLDFCGFSDDGTSLGTVSNETPHRLSHKAEDMACDASPRDLTEVQTSFETLPKNLLCTRVFHDLRGQAGEQTSPPLNSPFILRNTAKWDRTVGMHASRHTFHETGLPFQPSLLSSSLSIRGDSQTAFSADNSGDQASQLQLRSCLSMHFPVKSDNPTAVNPVSDAEDEIPRGHVNFKEEEEMEEEEEEEFEPGDRFCNHHRYQFLHWLHWRKEYDFVPNHLDRNGVVWLVTHRVDGLPYAVKEIPGTQQNTLQTELECLTLGNAPVNALQQQAADYITRYFSVSPYSVVSCDSHESMAFLLQTEYFPMGNVMEWALDPHRLRGKEFRVPPEDFWSCVLQHGLLAMESLHAAHIIHGNPLPFNLFISSPRHYKLGGFGSAVKFPSTYPVGSSNVFVPSNTVDGNPWTPYEVDIFLFAHSILQLWTHCIYKRKLVTNTGQTFDYDSESTLREIFMKDAMCISFSGFQEDRVKGYHEISDHLWNVLQAAFRRTPICTLLRMLDAPSRLQWTLCSIFDTEEFYLRRRQRRLERMLEERVQRNAKKEVKRQSLPSTSVDYVDDLAHSFPLPLPPPSSTEWSCRGHTAHRCSDIPLRGNMSTAVTPLSFQLPLAPLNTFASSGNGVTVSPGQGEHESCHPSDAACNRYGRTRFNGLKRLTEETPLTSCDTSAASYSPHLFYATKKFNLLKEKSYSFNSPLEEDMDHTSLLKSAHDGRPPYVRRRVEVNISSANRDVLDANLLWTIRQIMAVMNWEDALKGIALHFDESVPARGLFSLSRYAVRPLTSWE